MPRARASSGGLPQEGRRRLAKRGPGQRAQWLQFFGLQRVPAPAGARRELGRPGHRGRPEFGRRR
eukprot:8127253-Pyramimonas_sp.AAC.1